MTLLEAPPGARPRSRGKPGAHHSVSGNRVPEVAACAACGCIKAIELLGWRCPLGDFGQRSPLKGRSVTLQQQAWH